MKDFENDEVAADLLLPLIHGTFDAVIAVLPNSVKIAVKVAKHLGIEIFEFWGDDNLNHPTEFNKFLVIDDGVETGRKALEVARILGPTVEKHLAVPVCSREVEAALLGEYAKVYAVKRPFVRRSLAWHYEVRPEYSIAEARLILESALD